jgi:light-regulated signal transduction histidine kinase (bacteriophytochrome)
MAKMFGVETAVNSWRTPNWDDLSFRAFHKGRELQPKDFPMHVALKGTPVREFELDVLQANGAVRNLSGYADPLYDAQGKITGCVGAYVDLTEMRKMRATLERSNEELQRFAYSASHDLQSPLRTVRSFAQMLERHLEGKLDERATEFLSTILEGADRMTHLVRDLLAFAQAGHRNEPPIVVDVSVVLHEAKESLRLAISESGAVIQHGALPAVRAHPAHLLQLFQNLLSNAIKYRRVDVPLCIFISGQEHDGCCLFAVRDNGQGFDPVHSELIFEPFKRLHGKEISGTGIGLATCYRIIQRYRCRRWADSEGIGLGATFRFTMPLPDTTTESCPAPDSGTPFLVDA